MALRHKRDTDARPRTRRRPRAVAIAGPLAVLATASAVTIGVLTSDPASRDLVADDASAGIARPALHPVPRAEPLSRSSSRVAERKAGRRLQRAFDINMARTATLRAVRAAHVRMWTTTALNLWDGPGSKATRVGLIDSRKPVLVTGRKAAQRVELAVGGKSRWVTAGYLADHKPPKPKPEPAAPAAAAAPAGLSSAPCPDSSVENGLTSEAVRVYRAVCHAFPQITSYGGWDAHGEHSSGRAIDVMTSDQSLGDQIAAFLQSHASELDLYDVIWWDRIWTPERASEGWRDYGDHGSATANHMDHVHVSTNG